MSSCFFICFCSLVRIVYIAVCLCGNPSHSYTCLDLSFPLCISLCLYVCVSLSLFLSVSPGYFFMPSFVCLAASLCLYVCLSLNLSILLCISCLHYLA